MAEMIPIKDLNAASARGRPFLDEQDLMGKAPDPTLAPSTRRPQPKAPVWRVLATLVLLAAGLALPGTPLGIGVGPDGTLYVWSGTAWERRYMPYRYPLHE